MKGLSGFCERRQIMELQDIQTPKSPMDDEQIVALYWQRDEQAIAETDYKYKNYLLSIAYNVVFDRLDSEECVNDTYIGAWNAMPPTKPNVLKAFLTTITRRIAVKRYHKKLKRNAVPSEMTVSLSELEDFIAGEEDIAADFDAKRLGSVISDFVRALSQRRQYIFMSRYYAAEPIDAIAADLRLSRSMVNKELAAIRHALKEQLEREGYSL
jgi:RNA polymerase sigma-70 factor (ECF subfamily)